MDNPVYVSRPRRRIYLRFAVQASARVKEPYKKQQPAVVEDLSVRGACIAVTRPLAVEKKVTLDIIAPYWKNILQRTATVVWIKEAGKGWWHCGLDFGIDNLVQFR